MNKPLYWLIWITTGKCCPECGGGKVNRRRVFLYKEPSLYMDTGTIEMDAVYKYCDNAYHKETK